MEGGSRWGLPPRLTARVQQDGSFWLLEPEWCSAPVIRALPSLPSPEVLVLPLLGVLLPVRRGRGKRILRPLAPGRALTPPCPAELRTAQTHRSTDCGFADPQVTSLEGQLLVLLGLSGATGERVTSLPHLPPGELCSGSVAGAGASPEPLCSRPRGQVRSLCSLSLLS